MPGIGDRLLLASGLSLPNRLVKAAMEENLADAGQLPGDRMAELYRRWARGGAGLLITGHVMVDGRSLAHPADVVLQQGTPLAPFTRWAEAARHGGGRVLMQINHPGRVIYSDMPGQALSASDVAVNAGRYSRLFARPRPMTEADLEQVVSRFAATAARAAEAGFHGVQVHAAHGYLLAQFLSPLTNRRTDRWGGDLENRARLLMEVLRAIRASVPADFALAVKLNTADFQRGGFEETDAARIVAELASAGCDLVELSGGSVESLATHGHSADGRTLAREAYFLELAADIIRTAPLPVMITGGVRRREVAQRVLDQGGSLVGMATALAYRPDLPERWLRGEDADFEPVPVRWKDKTMSAGATQAMVVHRLHRLGRGRDGHRSPSPAVALARDLLQRRRALRRYRRWYAGWSHPAPSVPGVLGRP
ncbi:oxidoreductase [Streptomyces corynorhini]|uniref:2,4-dienoyl-CoA reductase n=1 Tax=Streptomyces corynorhini TaxID=2282652 RepID=A0A370B7S5_9ACTN|nr:2,4-dienoyl-CoA reductase [Streptomyces corynorhini]RDG36439.1 2,4-dienoyl-CoA reductase [Streptomyces corynorhini]